MVLFELDLAEAISKCAKLWKRIGENIFRTQKIKFLPCLPLDRGMVEMYLCCKF